MNEKEAKELFDRYRNNLCTPEEIKAIEHYLLKYPIINPSPWKNEAHKRDVDARIRAGLPMLPKAEIKQISWKTIVSYAAVAVLLIASGLWLLTTRQQSSFVKKEIVLAKSKTFESSEVTMIFPNGSVKTLHGKYNVAEDLKRMQQDGNSDTKPVLLKINVPAQRKQEVILGDGSIVWLNAGATLKLPQIFDKDHRTVYLEGEGYFEIAHNKKSPFKVMIDKGEVLVTGTKFNVQSFAEEDYVRTSLVEGGVDFKFKNKQYTLTPGIEVLTENKHGGIVQQKFDAAQLLSWKDGYFASDGLELNELMKVVSRWYNVTIIDATNAVSRKIGGTFSADMRT
ncbi:FecR family protein [Sphingobacterium sp. Ag1]|uniref:FecR family protein n=1 Tax=Sphingobacterium sp. Ag1 TaxID=1643451 RepID=UPI00069B7D49|nr:FecR domain-containing protein [Sphingobacterium sp. Ag1]